LKSWAEGRMKVLLGTLLVASLVFEAIANAKSDCENRVQETAGKLISDCQAEWDEKCARYDHNGDKNISTIEAEKSLFRLLARCQRPGNQKQRPGTQQKTNIYEECKKKVIAKVESLKGHLSAKEAKDKYYELIKRCEQPRGNQKQKPGNQQSTNINDECRNQVIAKVESLKGHLSAKEAKDKYYELIKRCEPRQPGNQKQRPTTNIQRLKNGLKLLLECQQLDKEDRSLTDGPCAKAKKWRILSVKNLEDLTDEKIELYVNRMKDTILKEREKAAKNAAANRKTDTRRQKERRQIQGLKLSLTLERKLTECVEKSLDPCTIDGKEYSMDQVKAALPNIKTENQRRRVLIQRNRQRQRAAQRGNRRKPKSRE